MSAGMRPMLFLRIASGADRLSTLRCIPLEGSLVCRLQGCSRATVAVMKANEFQVMGVTRSYGGFLPGAWSGVSVF